MAWYRDLPKTRTVYFATAKKRPDQIKIGWSNNLSIRCDGGGFQLLAWIPGEYAREQALHWILREHRTDHEWFRSCPAVWRVVVEAIDAGDLAWLPAEEDLWPPACLKARRAVLRAHFGTDAAAAERFGCAPSTIAAGPLGCGIWPRFVIERDHPQLLRAA